MQYIIVILNKLQLIMIKHLQLSSCLLLSQRQQRIRNIRMSNKYATAMPFCHKPEYQHQEAGLTKREHFAAMAMQGILSSGGGPSSYSGLAAEACKHADALLHQLDKE